MTKSFHVRTIQGFFDVEEKERVRKREEGINA